MKLTLRLDLLVLLALLAAACGGPSQPSSNTAEEPTNTAEENKPKVSEVSMPRVLNPNLVSAEELLTAPFMDENKVNALIDARPFLEAKVFVDFIQEQFTAEQAAEILANVFLPMNLNGPSEEDFLIVPGVGKKMAHEFEEYQPYASIAQFRREIGKYVDEEQVAKYEQYVFVPVNLNTASKEEILMIPGMGERMLHEFEEYRPYENIEQFRREIGKYVDDDELQRLERYVTF